MTAIPHPTAPLIRRRADGGWERLAFGSLLRGGALVYEPVEWDEAAYREKQRRAAKAREESDDTRTA